VRPCIFLCRRVAEAEVGGGATRGFDLDPSCTSEGEEGGRPSLHQLLPSSSTSLLSKRGTTLQRLDPFQRVVPYQRHQITDLEGTSGLHPLASKASQILEDSFFFSLIQGNPNTNPNIQIYRLP
jgi:hypothetical protein